MNARVLRTELRRSVAPWAGVLTLAVSGAFLYLLNGEWTRDTTAWTAQWTSLGLWTRQSLAYLWPIVIGLGALQGLRDHRSRMPELLASTPRPGWHRAAVTAGAAASTLVSAFGLLVLSGAVQVSGSTRYDHLGWLPITLLGAAFLVAGAVLGMGLGRSLPSLLTPPGAAIVAFAFTSLLHMSVGQRETTSPDGYPFTEPKRISLLSPAPENVESVFTTLSGSVHAGQTLWVLGLAATGFALLVAVTARARLLALTPLLAGTVLALLVLPTSPDRMYVLDEAASELVCDGPVCVANAHRDRLDETADSGRKALRELRAVLGDDAPRSVREITAVQEKGAYEQRSRKTVLFGFDDLLLGSGPEELTRGLVAKGLVPGCTPVGLFGFGSDEYAQVVSAAWVFGDFRPLPGMADGYSRAALDDEVRPVWKKFAALPRAEQTQRIKAMRASAFSCDDKAFDALKGGASR
ncbi:hypothetical protein [Streptomyces sp. NPDC054784]